VRPVLGEDIFSCRRISHSIPPECPRVDDLRLTHTRLCPSIPPVQYLNPQYKADSCPKNFLAKLKCDLTMQSVKSKSRERFLKIHSPVSEHETNCYSSNYCSLDSSWNAYRSNNGEHKANDPPSFSALRMF
jgi:hypothetical protein